MKPLPVAALAALLTLSSLRAADRLPVTLTPLADRVRVEIGGRLFTDYIYADDASRSYCYPILAPDGTPLTRNFPMKDVAGEDTDHKWHRSLFFAHSSVNGVDFWNESGGDVGHSPALKGHTAVDGEVRITSGETGVLRVRDRWLAPGNRLICTDRREIRFFGTADARFIDFAITLEALPDTPLVLGDNKDGSMAIRVAQWMTLPHAFKGRQTGGQGHLLTATGRRDDAAWGARADWCDYYAPHDGRIYGIAIFDNPRNLRHPTWWMARPYGLFGANPFGQHEYERKPDQPHLGDDTIPAGGHLTLRYRFYFHEGTPDEAGVAHQYEVYRGG